MDERSRNLRSGHVKVIAESRGNALSQRYVTNLKNSLHSGCWDTVRLLTHQIISKMFRPTMASYAPALKASIQAEDLLLQIYQHDPASVGYA